MDSGREDGAPCPAAPVLTLPRASRVGEQRAPSWSALARAGLHSQLRPPTDALVSRTPSWTQHT